MARIRSNNVFGTTTNDPLLVGSTTLNAAGLANLAAVVAPDTAIITLDPNRVNGAPEIVIVTAHTSSATSATITRGAFGTVARSHALGTEWVHGPVAQVSADDGDFGGFWQSWTPTLANLTLGNGTLTSRFTRTGDLVTYLFVFVLGSTSAVGSAPTFTLPVAASTAFAMADGLIGISHFLDAGTAVFPSTVTWQSGDRARFQRSTSDTANVTHAAVTATLPFSWATGDTLWATGTYEAALAA
jgi:hypothetical protein